MTGVASHPFGMVLALLIAAVPQATPAGPHPTLTPLVDHHQHLFSPQVAKLIRPDSSWGGISAHDLVALLDSAGIGRAVVLSVAYTWGSPGRNVSDEYARVRAENDWTADQVASAPRRLVGFCSVNPLKPYALDEVERCARNPWLRTGLKLHFGNSDVQLDESADVEQLRRVFAAANRHHMAIVVHLRESISRRRPYGAREARVFLEQVVPAAPDVPIQIAHLAGSGPGYADSAADSAMAEIARAVAEHRPGTDHLWFDVASIANDVTPDVAATIVRRIREVGVGHVLYGSDSAISTNRPSESWAAFCRLPLTRSELEAIAHNVAPYLTATHAGRSP